MKIRFDKNWLFNQSDSPEYMKKECDDQDWRLLDLPHDWSIEGEYDRNNPCGKRQAFLPMGKSWYRKHFTWDDSWKGKRVYIEFDGIYMNSRVYINGNLLGERPFGYISFQYDLTDYLLEGENILAVLSDTEKTPTDRWYTGSGIYRHCWLRTTEQVALDYNGAFLYWKNISTEKADFTGLVEIKNNLDQDWTGHLRLDLIEKNSGSPLFSQQFEAKANSDSITEVEISGTLENPALWYPESPELYQVEIKLIGGDLAENSHCFTTGIRSLDFEAPKGFELNGKVYKMQGVCIHHDAGPLGTAVPDNVLYGRLKQLKAMGCNTIRTSHNPFAPEFYEYCNELGLMVMDEIFDGWHKKAGFDYGAVAFDKWWKKDTIDWLKRDRNHPCVIFWSMGNETGERDIHGITEVCHQYDPTRPTTGGTMFEGVDYPGFNAPGGIPGALEKFQKDNPGKKAVLTEKPHTYATRGFYRTQTWYRDHKNPRFDVPDLLDEEVFHEDYARTHGYWACYNSSYDNAMVRMSARHSWQRTRDFDFIMGEFRWTGYDYLGESFGWPLRISNNGIMDLCSFEKDTYYFYQSQWTEKPMVHLLPHWTWPTLEGKTIPLWAYTNCDEVELFLNGLSLGKQSPGKQWDKLNCQWLVDYTPGKIEAVGYKDGKEVCRDQQETTTSSYDLTLTKNSCEEHKSLVPMDDIIVRAVDEEGRFVIRGANRIHFHVEGAAAHKALGNGDPQDRESHKEQSRRLFAGLAKAYIKPRNNKDDIELYAMGIMGNSYFPEKQKIAIQVKSLCLQGGGFSLKHKIFYTIDGSKATQASPEYRGSFEIVENTTVKALILLGDREFYLEETFNKGKGLFFDPHAVPDSQYISKNIIGTWKSEKTGQLYHFKENGKVKQILGDDREEQSDWWYADPIDPFEDATTDNDNGAICDKWADQPLKLIEGKLRLRITQSETELLLIKIKE